LPVDAGVAAMSIGVFYHYDFKILLLAAALASIASLNAVRLLQTAQQRQGRQRILAVAIAALASGCGAWAADFAAIMAYQPAELVVYSADSVYFSLVLGIAAAGLGLAMAVYFPQWMLAAGGVVGGGVAAMHQIAVRAVYIPGHSNAGFALTSTAAIALGILLGAAVIYLTLRRDGWRERAAAVALLALAIMVQQIDPAGAVEIGANAVQPAPTFPISRTSLAFSIAGMMGFVGVLGSFTPSNNAQNQLADALDKLSIGLLIFDAEERILACNKPYQVMYDVPKHIVAPPHGTLTRLLNYRTTNGTFREDPQQYLINLRKSLKDGSLTHREPTLVDGRIIAVSTHPMEGGGWVAIH
jgi:NO-binding membrane sensor protein with MHYT domain